MVTAIKQGNSKELFDLGKYTKDILDMFNKKYRTSFTYNMGVADGWETTSTLDKKSHQINITLATKALEGIEDKNRFAAVQILIGHELAHHLYANMTLSSMEVLKTVVSGIAGDFRKHMMSYSIETFCDIQGKNFYTELIGEVTQDTYDEYYKIMLHGEAEDKKVIASALKVGYLPPTYRLKYMKKHTSFRGRDYEIVQTMTDDICYLYEEFRGIQPDIQKYVSWIQCQMRFDNFAVRPNRIK